MLQPVCALFAVAPLLVDVCFVSLMALGVYVVINVVAHPPRGGPSEFSLFGSKVTVKGPAWLIMLIVGGIMAGAPVIAAASQRSVITPFEPTQSSRKVKKVPEPNYSSFNFSSDLCVLDLRNAVEEPLIDRIVPLFRGEGTHKRVRPATLTNTMVVKKTAPADYIYIKYATSGALDLRCLTHAYTTEMSENSSEGQIIADVRNVAVGEEFTIINEVTYWNAFRGEAGDDFTTYTHNQQNVPERISLAIIFPDDKPFKAVEMLEQPPDSDQMRRATVGVPYPATGNTTFYWSATTPGGEWFFTSKWLW